jgi:hypothetical protein
MDDAAIAGRTANAAPRAAIALQSYCQDAEPYNFPAAPHTAANGSDSRSQDPLWQRRVSNKLPKNAAKCSKSDISIPFRTFDVRNMRRASICEG